MRCFKGKRRKIFDTSSVGFAATFSSRRRQETGAAIIKGKARGWHGGLCGAVRLPDLVLIGFFVWEDGTRVRDETASAALAPNRSAGGFLCED